MKTGRKPSLDLLYARQIGLTKMQVRRLGGATRLDSLLNNRPDVWLLMVSQARKSRKVCR